jgi:hypothetical protein
MQVGGRAMPSLDLGYAPGPHLLDALDKLGAL